MANRTILTGNLTRDPEKVENSKELDIARFSIAVNRRGKTPRTDFFDVTAFQHTAKNVLEYKKKGDPVLVEGHLQQDQWDDKDTGKKRSRVVVIADNVEFLGRGGSDDAGTSKDDNGNTGDIPF
jgi:single-strand DNA-binding protein